MRLVINAVGSMKGTRYYIEYPEGKLHILNMKSLEWQLRKTFKLSKTQVVSAIYQLNTNGKVMVDLTTVAA